MANFSWQLCNSQNVEEIIMNLQYFWKNVNKQLKSADFLTEISKFQKIHLNEVFAFFNLSSKHTLIFVVHQPNVKYFIFPITDRIYVVKQKRKQITNFVKHLHLSQMIVYIILNLHIFWKNVNKQLKSADFFLETSKY